MVHKKKKKHDNNGLVVTLEIIPNLEFEKLILSFGEKVKIISPKKNSRYNQRTIF